eukprot:gnl/TRDRNA2_/TRDRNA2_128059_c1_seq1.p2 gnl/TRDRNA2_/TRDRNA2_128059_c1~~gnl/TRDRNA2_/TRDRNA2_128059_c1_seq1.p2  ORF type:complete len:101 (-),score=2.30 gnl/TRDRNA2_/TRDRNA2_128059_c1_seq1:349-651(-)
MKNPSASPSHRQRGRCLQISMIAPGGSGPDPGASGEDPTGHGTVLQLGEPMKWARGFGLQVIFPRLGGLQRQSPASRPGEVPGGHGVRVQVPWYCPMSAT